MYHLRFGLFLDKKVDVVDAERSQLLDRALERHEETTKRDVSVDGVSIECLLKLVDLAMAHIVVEVGNRGWRITALTNVPPALLFLLAAIQSQCCCQNNMQRVTTGTWEQLNVDVERHDGLRVGRCARNTCDTIVLGLIVLHYGKGLLKEGGISASHFERVMRKLGYLKSIIVLYRGK
jgi:hypothetical protein